MPHVTVSYEMFLPGSHHRQPRNSSMHLDLAPTAGGDIAVSGIYTPPFFPLLPYNLPAGSGFGKLIFWSVTDGMSGQVLSPVAFDQPVGLFPLTITGWYFPTSGPGGINGQSAILDDAFSANLGRFIDDTFVDVTSDPTLTNDANVIGIVPTAEAETLEAKNSVTSTTEPFSQWILNDGPMPVAATTLHVEKGASGIAVAVYQQPQSIVRRIPHEYGLYNPWWWIETRGGLVPPGPPQPWLREWEAALSLADTTNKVSSRLRAGVLELALQQLSISAAAIKKEIKAIQGK